MERRDVAAHQWNPHLRSGLHCFLIALQFLLLHFTFALHLYFSTTSSHSLWSATVNSWLSSSWTPRFGRVGPKISQHASQGTFDYRTTVRENMTVFALSTMTSSVLVYNVQHGIREDHLQVLESSFSFSKFFLCSICSCSQNMAEWR